jgi:hypothetical protein
MEGPCSWSLSIARVPRGCGPPHRSFVWLTRAWRRAKRRGSGLAVPRRAVVLRRRAGIRAFAWPTPSVSGERVRVRFAGSVTAVPLLGGLHHDCRGAAGRPRTSKGALRGAGDRPAQRSAPRMSSMVTGATRLANAVTRARFGVGAHGWRAPLALPGHVSQQRVVEQWGQKGVVRNLPNRRISAPDIGGCGHRSREGNQES